MALSLISLNNVCKLNKLILIGKFTYLYGKLLIFNRIVDFSRLSII